MNVLRTSGCNVLLYEVGSVNAVRVGKATPLRGLYILRTRQSALVYSRLSRPKPQNSLETIKDKKTKRGVTVDNAKEKEGRNWSNHSPGFT